MALPDPGLPTPKLLRESTDLTFSSTFTSSSTRSFSYTPNAVTFTRTRTRTRTRLPLANKHKYRILHQPLFRNSLLAGVGYLELANAADFAANVWNEIPVPLHAKILMAIGGPCALCMTLVAARDMYLSAANVRLLRRERTFLADSISASASSADHTDDGPHRPTPHPSSERSTIDRLNEYKHGVNTREVLTEVIDRILMDLLMGVGALLVGIGTLLAIWGADPTIYRASNLLSGYVGNGLAAGFGLVNAIWSAYLVWRFQRCWRACAAAAAEEEGKIPRDQNHELPASLKTKLRARMRALQFHAVVNGVNGVVAGAASMVTATMWYGYVVLVPCIVSLILLNVFWRARLGYDRSLGTFSSTGLDAESCTAATATTAAAAAAAAENPVVHATIPEDDSATDPDHDHPSPPPPSSPAALAHHKEDIDRDPPNEDALSILLTELAYVSEMHRALLHTNNDHDASSHRETETKILRTLQLPITTLTPITLLAFITHHNLWESFCVWLIESQSQSPSLLKRMWDILRFRFRFRRHPSLTSRTTEEELDAILGLGRDANPDAISPVLTSTGSERATSAPAAAPAAAPAEVTLHHPEDLLTRCKDPTLLVRKMTAFLVGNVTRCFAYRERYLLEMVGYAIWKESLAHPGAL
ncbi:uncharacterized protein BO66DRAFT_387678 [Aspergillus aculeatinus CBS 121060]|uniref:Uncharacterized protein n=1 Tax=Aspergillus aculeatinus CBS 121060 TaxID=1448322 RepID=A0ACD1HMF0_9EURO|nr:hypothetical protein BO66DRAFT_387678 [Aspergillus aculeatinus CBS 121060]RAH74857.1 hypothetical protein BO66DRAFT_387678 [Aspergillus aculeatinus CBS 121060]